MSLGVSGILKVNGVSETAMLAQRGHLVVSAVRLIAPGAAADIYCQLFDAAATTDITVGTTKPDWVAILDFATGETSVGDGLSSSGMKFDRGLVIACTAGPENNVAPSVNPDLRFGIW